MSEENVEVVRTGFDQFARGDFGRWFALTTDDFEFVTSPDIPDAGTYYGEDARRWMTAWVRSFEGHTLTLEATEIIDAGSDNVIAGFLQRGHPSWERRHGGGTLVDGGDLPAGRDSAHRELPPSRRSPRSRWAAGVGPVLVRRKY